MNRKSSRNPFLPFPGLSLSEAVSPRIPLLMALIVVFAALFNLSCRIRGPEKLDGVVYNVDQNDIPIPLGFQRRPNSSWSYGHQFQKPFRSWKSTYLGEGKPRKVASWYIDQMPKEGWLLKSNFKGSKRILTYLKGTEEVAEIEIYDEYFPNEDTFKTIVVAAIRPLSTPDSKNGQHNQSNDGEYGYSKTLDALGGFDAELI